MIRYAEDANYFSTTVHPAVSQGEISELLENFGASSTMIMTGQAGGKHALMVRFQWEARSYRFVFSPLECRDPEKVTSIGGKRLSAFERSRYQMGRIAVNFVKAILTAAEATPDSLFGFLELPGVSNGAGMPRTAAELNVEELTGLLPMPEVKLIADRVPSD